MRLSKNKDINLRSKNFGNGNPPKPYGKNTDLCDFLFDIPLEVFPYNFCELIINNYKTVYFLQVIPIYKEEMDYALTQSPEQLKEKFSNQNIPIFVDFKRQNVLKDWKILDGVAETIGIWCPKCNTVVRNFKPKQKEIKCSSCGFVFNIGNQN